MDVFRILIVAAISLIFATCTNFGYTHVLSLNRREEMSFSKSAINDRHLSLKESDDYDV